jgi:hypothetical protein
MLRVSDNTFAITFAQWGARDNYSFNYQRSAVLLTMGSYWAAPHQALSNDV